MIRILTSAVVAVFSFAAVSCCCTSDSKPPGLRPLPSFSEIQPADSAPVVDYRSAK